MKQYIQYPFTCLALALVCSCSILNRNPADTKPALVLISSETNNILGNDGEWHSITTHDIGYKQGTNWVRIGVSIQP